MRICISGTLHVSINSVIDITMIGQTKVSATKLLNRPFVLPSIIRQNVTTSPTMKPIDKYHMMPIVIVMRPVSLGCAAFRAILPP
jgi:hypothetical protein